jgi:VanZ family protein
MRNLRRYWFIAGAGWLALVVYLSLANIHLPQSSISWGDKVNHVVAYGFLMTWFGQLTRRSDLRAGIAIFLIAIGVLMEVLQSRLPYRWFEILDALANCGGVIAACIVLSLGADRFLDRLEYRFG